MTTIEIERDKLELLIRVDTVTIQTATDAFLREFALLSRNVNQNKLAALVAA